MAWEWSHSQEAYDNARHNLKSQPHKWLHECYAEILSYGGQGFHQQTYTDGLAVLKMEGTSDKDIRDLIWLFMRDFRTCTNGGHEAYCCPYGCHTVPFDPLTEEGA